MERKKNIQSSARNASSDKSDFKPSFNNMTPNNLHSVENTVDKINNSFVSDRQT